MTRVRIRASRSALWRTVAVGCTAAGVLLVGYFVTETSPLGRSTPAIAPTATPPPRNPSPEPTPTPDFVGEQNRVTVSVFFLDPSTGRLRAEARDIFETRGVASRAKQAVTHLLAGPVDEGLLPLFPPGGRVEELFVDESGEVVLGLSPESLTPTGISEELLGLSGLALTLSRNFPEIARMRILVGGLDAVTLRGHISIEYPLATVSELYDSLLADDRAEP